MKILLIDNYDSFTYNLFHYLSSLKCSVDVYRNDKISIKDILKKKYQKIVISPGPGNPNQAGNCIKIVKSLYKKIPEYRLLNSTMTLEQFKTIYWWEYTHRLLGRLIGLLYFLPLLYFTYKKMIKKNSLIYFYLILFLLFLQGFVGWYMVKSGLTERTDVSHYRLSLHLNRQHIEEFVRKPPR